MSLSWFLIGIFWIVSIGLFLMQEYLEFEIPGITSYIEQPLNIQALPLKQVIQPSYSAPFQKFTYIYESLWSESSLVIEESVSLFSSMTRIISGWNNIQSWYTPSIDGIFKRWLAITAYSNGLYFLIQYLLIISMFIIWATKYLKLRYWKS